MLGEEGLAVGIRTGRIELAELPAERQQLRIRESLPAEAQHEMVEPGLADFGEGFRRERPRQIDTGHFGAESVRQLFHLDRRHGAPRYREAYPRCLRKNSSERVRASLALSAWYDPR